MGKLSKFLGKPEEAVIGGETLLLQPLTIKDLDLIVGMGQEGKQAESMKGMIVRTLKRSYPDEDVNFEEVSISYIQELMEAILRVNNLSLDSKTKVHIQDIPKA